MTNTYIVTGADSGLGKHLSDRLEDHGEVIRVGGPSSKLPLQIDFRYPEASRSLVDMILGSFPLAGRVHLINCAGVNYIEWFDRLRWPEWDNLMNINAKAQVHLTYCLQDWLRNGTVCNIVSNASHMAMTNSVFYNASKGAAHIATLAMARELGKTHGLTIFGVSPNKMSGTQMSAYIDGRVPELRGWSPEEAQRYQLAGLPAGVETPPERVAEFIAFLLSDHERHRYLHGTIIPYGGPM